MISLFLLNAMFLFVATGQQFTLPWWPSLTKNLQADCEPKRERSVLVY